MKVLNTLLAGLLLPCTTQAATIIVSDSATSQIPDGNGSGLARQLTVNAPNEAITNLQLAVDISAVSGGVAFLGDLYLYLSHGSDLAVVINRPGRRVGSTFGYDDDQSISVTFEASAANDIHSYRLPLNGNHTTPLSSSLTGSWRPDGRATDPSFVLDTDSRTADFSVFNGDIADGNWFLFAADLSTGAAHQLTGWTLTLTTTTVPEPTSTILACFGAVGLLARRKR